MTIEQWYMRILNLCTLSATSTWSIIVQTKGRPLDVIYWLPKLCKMNWTVAGKLASVGMCPVSNKITLVPPDSQENEIEVEIHDVE